MNSKTDPHLTINRRGFLAVTGVGLASLPLAMPLVGAAPAAVAPARKWLMGTAYAVPKWTATEGEGYFSIIEGLNGRLYIGTHANGVNSWLVEFSPATGEMIAVVDAHKAIGKDLRGFGSQSKIHTRNNTGASGRIYFGTKQGYPNKDEKREDYPGGYPMVYDPKTGETKVYPIPVPHHGINSITPDESRGVAYLSTCADHRPGPGENAVFLSLDLKTGKYRELIDTQHYYGFVVVDYLGRAYHPILGGEIARYNPATEKLERLKQTIDGKPPSTESRLALPKPDPINWDISPDGKTLYAVAMSGNNLYSYDLTAKGDTLQGRHLGTLIPGAKSTDCRAMCVGPKGTVWASVTEPTPEGVSLNHLVTFRPGDKSARDLGPVGISNPNYTDFTDANNKPLPYHIGITKMPDGVTTSRWVTMGVCEDRAGFVYMLIIQPFTVIQIKPPKS